jgi:RND superfamily putative drug exporter
MIIALVLDATVVRMLLVPALLRMLGNAAWWAPGPLRRLQQRAGLAEYADEELFPTVSVGRHAAPDDDAVARPTLPPKHAPGPAVVPAPGPAVVPAPGPAAPVAFPGHAEPGSDRDPSSIRLGTGERSTSPRTEQPSVRFVTGNDTAPDPDTTVVLDTPATVDLSARRVAEHPDHR